MIAAH